MKYNFTLFIIIAIFNFTAAQNIDATLVELNFQRDSDPQNLTSSQSGFYFTASDGDFNKSGRELWHSNGTKQGTRMIKDIRVGQNSSNPISLVTLNNILYFTANDGVHGIELWKSDGTETGTSMVKDIRPNNDSEYDGPSRLIIFNGKLYFSATNDIHGYELWTSDGTESGTYMVKDINLNGDSNPNDLFVFNNNLYFIANDGKNGVELWKSDGTESGTIIVKNINSNFSALNKGNQFLILNNNFYFFANDGIKGFELWKSDGTEIGTQLVKDIVTGSNSSSLILKGGVINNMIIFESSDGINGSEIWKSDGTPSGTLIIKNINNTNYDSVTYDSKFIEFRNEIYFIANDNIHGDEIWKTDGTSNGTILLKDINDGNLSIKVNKFYVDKINNKLLFYTSIANSSDRKLWVSDGTSNGTLELANIKYGNLSGLTESFVTVNDITFLTGENETNGNELWRTDGTTAGTSFFADLNYSSDSNASKFTNNNGNVFFSARGKEYGNQLFKSDGTIDGTQLIKDINPGSESIDDLSEMKVINGILFFSATDTTHGYELWKSDGTENGTVMVKDINSGNKSSMRDNNEKQPFTVINNILYFYANDGVNGFELWRSDGTESGTYMIKDIYPGFNFMGGYGSYPKNFTLLNNIIYFIANDNAGTGLWKTNGTQSGTVKVISLNDMRFLTTVNNKLIIVAETSGTSYGPHNLLVSDGTETGTKHLKTFGDGIDSEIRITTTLNNELYFVAQNPDSARKAFYKTDGTLKGTIMLFDGATHPTMPDLKINNILTCENYVYFAVQDFYLTSKELWRTNGSITEKIAEANTDDFSSIRSLTCYNDNLLYLAENFPHKIWLINNNLSTPIDLNINITNSQNFQGYDSIEELATTKNNIYFRARNEINGSELYISKVDNSSLGIPDHQSDSSSEIKQTTLYPNPASEFVMIKSNKFELVKFELWDSSGKKIDQQANKDLKREVKYNVSKLSAGIYFVKATLVNGKIDNLKLVVN